MNSFKYFTQVTGAQIFAKHQFQLLNLNFTMKSASFSIAILSFFSRHGLYFHPTKDRPRMRPTSTFLYICSNFGKIYCTNVIQFVLCKITCCTLFNQLAILTYSALLDVRDDLFMFSWIAFQIFILQKCSLCSVLKT